jgi:hypothetical protein
LITCCAGGGIAGNVRTSTPTVLPTLTAPPKFCVVGRSIAHDE